MPQRRRQSGDLHGVAPAEEDACCSLILIRTRRARTQSAERRKPETRHPWKAPRQALTSPGYWPNLSEPLCETWHRSGVAAPSRLCQVLPYRLPAALLAPHEFPCGDHYKDTPQAAAIDGSKPTAPAWRQPLRFKGGAVELVACTARNGVQRAAVST